MLEKARAEFWAVAAASVGVVEPPALAGGPTNFPAVSAIPGIDCSPLVPSAPPLPEKITPLDEVTDKKKLVGTLLEEISL
jgi:hypothetical protein